MAEDAHRIVARYAELGEKIHTAFAAYTGSGFRRRVVGVTDRRLLVVKSRYWSLKDKGLLWADPLDQIALREGFSVWRTAGVDTGNTYVTIRRADQSTFRLNVRSGFFGRTEPATLRHIETLHSLIPGRF